MEPSEIHQETKGQSQNSDRISALPQDMIEKILTHMPIQDALRTSILSKKWRYSWTRMPKLVFNDNMVNVSSDMEEEIVKYKLVTAIFHVLLLHRAPILEFSLFLKACFNIEIDQIILHLSRSNNNNIKKFIFFASGIDSYLLPGSFFSLQGLDHLDLTGCVFDRRLMNIGFSMLKSLSFFEVDITNEMLFKLLTNCPLLEEFTWIGEEIELEFTDWEMVELFKCLPSVQVLEISKLNIKHLDAGGMPHKLPISLVHLRILVFGVCFLELSSVLCVMGSSPNLEKIKIQMCWTHDRWCPFQQTCNNLPDIQEYSDVNLDHLKELEITRFRNHAPEMEFVKLIMANSPVLKKARIQLALDFSVDDENKMLRELVHMPIPRASPAVRFTIERPKEFDQL